MLSSEYNLTLEKDDLCALITIDGDLIDIYFVDYELVCSEADMITDYMLRMLSDPVHDEGVWIWHIKKHGREITAEQIFND